MSFALEKYANFKYLNIHWHSILVRWFFFPRIESQCLDAVVKVHAFYCNIQPQFRLLGPNRNGQKSHEEQEEERKAFREKTRTHRTAQSTNHQQQQQQGRNICKNKRKIKMHTTEHTFCVSGWLDAPRPSRSIHYFWSFHFINLWQLLQYDDKISTNCYPLRLCPMANGPHRATTTLATMPKISKTMPFHFVCRFAIVYESEKRCLRYAFRDFLVVTSLI